MVRFLIRVAPVIQQMVGIAHNVRPRTLTVLISVFLAEPRNRKMLCPPGAVLSQPPEDEFLGDHVCLD